MEEWRLVEGYEYYEVSNLGRVRSWINNKQKRRNTPKILSLHRLTKGYLGVSLSSAPNVSRTIKVHRLVAKAFIIREWNSATEAAKELKIDCSRILTACHKSYKGFVWDFKEKNCLG